MAGLLNGLERLGLGSLKSADVLADEEKKDNTPERPAQKKVEIPKVLEKDLVYDKSFTCKVCRKEFTAKVMKTGKSKLLGIDFALRPRYEGIAAEKYDVILCPNCGYAALSRYFDGLIDAQARLIRDNISKNVILTKYIGDTYSFDQALERYKLALANAVVKKCRLSERAFICLKTAWVLRSYQEALEGSGEADADKIKELKSQENEYLRAAYDGFLEARQKEDSPIAGMDSVTLDYLLAELAAYFKDYEVASRMIAGILTMAGANARIKDKARILKDQILEAKKG